MIEIKYRIVLHDYDDFKGQNGFFQIKCHDFAYGDMYPSEIEHSMDTIDLYDWFERMLKILFWLKTKDFVALSDTESYNTWITFSRINSNVILGIRLAKKENGIQAIEFQLHEPTMGEWIDQTISYHQLREEVLKKSRMYLNDLNNMNADHKYIEKLKKCMEEAM